MRLAFSQLAWPAELDEEGWETVRRAGFDGVELIPGRACEIDDTAGLERLLNRCRQTGLRPVAFQALLYGTSGLVLFRSRKERNALFKRLICVANFAANIGVPVLVFGSPKNRRIDTANPAWARQTAVTFFRALADEQPGVNWAIEPNAAAYGGDWLLDTGTTMAFIEEVNRSSLGINLDLGTMILNHEDPAAAVECAGPWIRHVHASEPHLRTVGVDSAYGHAHEALARALRKCACQAAVSVEMMPAAEDAIGAIARTAEWVLGIYTKGGGS